MDKIRGESVKYRDVGGESRSYQFSCFTRVIVRVVVSTVLLTLLPSSLESYRSGVLHELLTVDTEDDNNIN